MDKYLGIGVILIAVGMLTYIYLDLAWESFKPIPYTVEYQTPKTITFFYDPPTRVFNLSENIAPKSYSWVFVENPQLPRFSSEENITAVNSYLRLEFVCNGTFNIYAFNASNFNSYVKNASCSAMSTIRLEEYREMFFNDPVHISPHGKLYYCWVNLNIPNNSSNIYIVFENPDSTHLFLNLSAMPKAYCEKITGYVTEHLIRYDYTPIHVRSFLLTLVVLLIVAGLPLSVIGVWEQVE